MADDAAELDREYGKRMKALRDDRGLTQAEVVRRMKEAGVRYMNASTLSRIESGLRALRLSEADALSGIYAFPLSMLTLREPSFDTANKTMRRLDESRSRHAAFRRLVSELVTDQLDAPGLARGLDLIYQRATDEDLLRRVDKLKRNLQEFAGIDLEAELAEIREHATQERDRLWKRVKPQEMNDGEHQAEA
ncbi:helix-turn-helix domain-containing protein [Microbacterium aerolatum]|uniref:helix-turn-helix domain-containing protein n=1 Tax=Microbacterium aerolatum TaxID=153731 RepID=UPI003850C03A